MVNVTIGTGVGAGIILGCGVMHQEQLYPLVREKTLGYLGGYITAPELADIDSYIVAPSLNDN